MTVQDNRALAERLLQSLAGRLPANRVMSCSLFLDLAVFWKPPAPPLGAFPVSLTMRGRSVDVAGVKRQVEAVDPVVLGDARRALALRKFLVALPAQMDIVDFLRSVVQADFALSGLWKQVVWFFGHSLDSVAALEGTAGQDGSAQPGAASNDLHVQAVNWSFCEGPDYHIERDLMQYYLAGRKHLDTMTSNSLITNSSRVARRARM